MQKLTNSYFSPAPYWRLFTAYFLYSSLKSVYLMRYSKYAASVLSQRIVNKTVAGSRSDKSRACLEYINKLLV